MTLAHRLGNAVSGSLTYSYGRAWREGVPLDLLAEASGFSTAFREAGYHDVVARVETFIDLTDTRLTAYYRVNTLDPETESGSAFGHERTIRHSPHPGSSLPAAHHPRRLGASGRGPEPLLRGLRGSALDEIASLHAPKRFMGGFAVKF